MRYTSLFITKREKKIMSNQRALFATKIGAIAATVGSAVGLGNIWRFPYEAGVHGGGAFLLLYIFFIIILGVPVLCSEFTLGMASRKGIFGAYESFKPGSKWGKAGFIGIIASILILGFYSVVSGWTMEYMMQAVTGNIYGQSEEQLHNAFSEFTSGWRPIMWTLIFLAINYVVIIRGVEKGIETMSNILTPLLLIIIVAFCINSLYLPAAKEGLEFLFKPDFSAITPSVVIGALGQAFFSLSLGLGCMLTYSSYFKENTDIVKSAGITATLDTLIAIMAGILIFPAVFSFGFSPSGGPKLVFEVLPAIFSQMTGGRIWSMLFFFMLFLASLTSTISMTEITVTYLTENRHMKRKKACGIVIGITTVLGILCALSSSYFTTFKLPVIGQLNFFDWFDYFSSNILLPLGGLVASLFVGWILDKKILRKFLSLTSNGKPAGSFRKGLVSAIIFAIRYIAPLLITIIFIINLI